MHIIDVLTTACRSDGQFWIGMHNDVAPASLGAIVDDNWPCRDALFHQQVADRAAAQGSSTGTAGLLRPASYALKGDNDTINQHH